MAKVQFINHSEEKCDLDSGWRPKGFERFLSDFGIVAEEVGARERSVAKAVVQKVVQNIEK